MSILSSFPLKHVSIRVPWHDQGWNGTVCACPKYNSACLKLTNIADKKREDKEERVKGKSIRELQQEDFPACVTERGTFMADFAFQRVHDHPYKAITPETHDHFGPTILHYPAYSAAGLPFRWMMKKLVWGDLENGIPGFTESFPLEAVDESREPELKFTTNWIQDAENHRVLLNCFWSHVRPRESLVFFYAKQIPLVEDSGNRILVGVGRVTQLGPLMEYTYTKANDGKIRSMLWERMVQHSIRPDFEDGFLLPYQEALEKSKDGEAFDPAEVVAFAPEDSFDQFSYATEHVANDSAISSLLACRKALRKAHELFEYPIQKQEAWIDKELGRLWKKRGIYPGLGAVLKAIGVSMGNFIAQEVADKAGENIDPAPTLDLMFEKPKEILSEDLASKIDQTISKAWERMPQKRKQFLLLLSRIDLNEEQANFLAIPEIRRELGLELEDDAFLENPYLIYEATRLSPLPISIGKVDRAVLSHSNVQKIASLPKPSLVETAVDIRRLRALVLRELELAALAGDTLKPRDGIIVAIRGSDSGEDEHRTLVTADLLGVAEADIFEDEVRLIKMADGKIAYQLGRYSNIGAIIRSKVNKRIDADRFSLKADWEKELNSSLPPLPENSEERLVEERARSEKIAALAELAGSRFSVLIGGAGTGKTTLLSILCKRPEIHSGRILLLAPTGKARVRMEEMAQKAAVPNFEAKTLAQFLAMSGRYRGDLMRYVLTGEIGDSTAETVIVDECSMLTEEMMAALFESLASVKRLIFVGDPRQLPPIGAGRPFVDVISRLQPANIESLFPRVGPGYAELTVPRRQGSGDRDDLQLASWFGGMAKGAGEDEVFEILCGKRKSETIEFVRWETPDDLAEKLPDLLKRNLAFDTNLEEWQAFACSLGGKIHENHVYFNWKHAGAAAENWQILSPVRQKPWGVETLNRLIHERYKANQLKSARMHGWARKIPKPMGDQQIVYGDKVINNRNCSVWASKIYPKPAANGSLANGEIGMVVGQLKTGKMTWIPKNLEIEFATQTGKKFTFWQSDFDDEGEASLDLAYALTIHKAQGSEFNTVFLVLPKSTLMVTRELLYTALTRQKAKVIVLHQGEAIELQKLSSEQFSTTARRLTNLFRPPNPVAVQGTFLEDRLIHRTARGEAVRSKSEVIIADHLFHKKVPYLYEHALTLGGVTKYPDFTIIDDDAGRTYFWEHCGMLHEPSYQKRWKQKKQWYRENGILPQDEGGGPNGILVVTEDSPNGGISSSDILGIADQIAGV